MNIKSQKISVVDGLAPIVSPWERTGVLLRDFFHSSDETTMRQAATALFELHQERLAQDNLLSSPDWNEIEYDFNRLFVGPMALQAAPYSSVYLDADALLMGKSTLKVRELSQSMGLFANPDNPVPDDHVSYEIELSILLVKNVQDDVYREALDWFISEHMNLWIPLFAEKMATQAKTLPMKSIAALLIYWFDELKTRVLS